MECLHFSHTHGLIVHQVPAESQVTCSGCKFPGTGSIYTCWQCSFFLHEQCFHAARSMNHPSHPTHPLTLVPYPTYPSNSFFCNSCNLVGSGLSYSCSNCEFDIHVHCASMPNSTTTHESYPHSMNLNYPIPYEPPIPQNKPIPMYPPHNYDTMPNSIAPMSCLVADQHQTNQTPYVSYPTGDQVPKNNFFTSEPICNPVSLYHPHHYETSPSFTGSVSSATQVADRPQAVPPQGYPDVNQTSMKKHIKHFSHHHPLRVSEVREEDSIVCSGCEEVLLGPAYSCITSKCDFNLHKSCFELAREIKHESHITHSLVLLSSPPYKEHGEFRCNACLNVGSSFTYHCKTCQYDLHINCASMPKTVKREDHEHALVLFFASQLKKAIEDKVGLSFSCDVCKKIVDERCWIYYCQKCDFGTHLECVATSQNCSQGQTYEESSVEAEQQMQLLMIQMEMNKQATEFMVNSATGIKY